jgi:hypothetical protein
LDFEGVEGETLALVTDFDVVGVDCEAMARDLRKFKTWKWRGSERFGMKKRLKPFRLKGRFLIQFSWEFKKDPGQDRFKLERSNLGSRPGRLAPPCQVWLSTFSKLPSLTSISGIWVHNRLERERKGREEKERNLA